MRKSFYTYLFFTILLLIGVLLSPVTTHTAFAAEDCGKIHFIALPYTTDAILIECNGQFGMVDSGEDTDYPSGEDPRYPDRPGITKLFGCEDTVIQYLHSVGVTQDNFEFYIATHPHSDHIGSADEIIYEFHPKRVYIEPYSDSDCTSSNELWDNLYIYDHTIQAAEDTNAALIQYFDPEASVYPNTASSSEENGNAETYTSTTASPNFYLGGLNGLYINIMNYGVPRPISNMNSCSLGVKITSMVSGKTAFLAGDINNYYNAEDILAGELGHIDLLKFAHHGLSGSNTPSFLQALSPSVGVLTKGGTFFTDSPEGEIRMLQKFLNLGDTGMTLYGTGWYSNEIPALVFELNEQLDNNIPEKSFVLSSVSMSTYYSNGLPTITSGWHSDSDNNLFYFENSRVAVSNKWAFINGNWYYFSASGIMRTGWLTDNGKYYYLEDNGAMAAAKWLYIDGNWYYFNSSGIMQTGWLKLGNQWYYLNSNGTMMGEGWHWIDNKCYYMYSSGVMASNTWIGAYYVDTSGAWVQGKTKTPTIGWQKDNIGWWYLNSDGSYPRSIWKKIDNKWYFFNQTGYMVTGWLKLGTTWYYLNSDGSMLENGWHWINGKCYYMYTSGAMAANTWIGNYYVNASGAWVP